MALFELLQRLKARICKAAYTVGPLKHCEGETQFWEKEYSCKSTEEDIYYCFRLLLGRNPGKTEWSSHRHLVNNELVNVVSKYLSSPEFKGRKLNDLASSEHRLVDLDDFRMYVSLSDIDVGLHIEKSKSYEPNVTGALKELLRPGMTFIDIGANIGFFSLLAAYHIGPKGRVHAFEPFQYNLKLLYLNTRINHFENVAIYPFALADKNGLVGYDNSASNGQISAIDDDLSGVMATTLTYCVRMDDVLKDMDRMDIIKIDIEGAEYLALSGGRLLLSKFTPVVLSEFSPFALEVVSKVSGKEYLELLLVNEDYSLRVLEPSGGVVDCGRDPEKVMNCFEAANSDHIDIAALPSRR